MLKLKCAIGATLCIIITILAGAAIGRVAAESLPSELPLLSSPLQVETPVVTPTKTSRFSLLIEKDGQGQVEQRPWPSAADNKYASGTTVYLDAFPAYGWELKSWSGDVTGTSSQISLVMNSDKRLTVHFQAGFASTVSLVPDVQSRIDQIIKKKLS